MVKLLYSPAANKVCPALRDHYRHRLFLLNDLERVSRVCCGPGNERNIAQHKKKTETQRRVMVPMVREHCFRIVSEQSVGWWWLVVGFFVCLFLARSNQHSRCLGSHRAATRRAGGTCGTMCHCKHDGAGGGDHYHESQNPIGVQGQPPLNNAHTYTQPGQE